jgi:hypothetical protein
MKPLYATHKVNLHGASAGVFFAERLDGTADGILHYDKSGMLMERPGLTAAPLDWHRVNRAFVPEGLCLSRLTCTGTSRAALKV